MRSDKDKRTETEKEIDDFLSKFESPEDESSTDYSTYLEPEENRGSDAPSFSWKDVDDDASFFESPTDTDDANIIAGMDDAGKTAKKSGEKKSEEKRSGKKKNRKNANKPAKISALDIEHLKEEIEEELGEESKDKPIEQAKTESGKETAEESSKKPDSYKAERKKRRSRDVVRHGSPSVPSAEMKDDANAAADNPPEPTDDEENKESASKAVEEAAAKLLVSGAGAEMSGRGRKKKRSGRKKPSGKSAHKDREKPAVTGPESAADRPSEDRKPVREVIKDTEKDVRDVKDIDDAVVFDYENKEAVKKETSDETAAPGSEPQESSSDKKDADNKDDEKKDVEKIGDEKKDAVKKGDQKKDDKKSSSEKGVSPKSSSKKTGVRKPGKKIKKNVIIKKASGITGKIRKRKGDRTLAEFLFLKPNPDYDPSKGETYEKDGRTVKNKKNRLSILKILGNIAAVFLVFVLAGMIYALGCIISAPKYDYKDIYSAVDTASVIYDDQNKPIDNVFYTENRKIIKYKDMPEDLVNAFVAIEDKTFWKHHGFNWTRMIGAIISSLTGNGRISGTSTITQQLARNVYLADTKSVRSVKRKLLEMYYANRIEHSLSKEQIVEAYLNTIYLGHGCYGVNSAARTYFSKDVKDLDLVECAALAALPQSPDTYALLKLSDEAQDAVDPKVVATDPDTIVTNDVAKGRRQLTLDLMLDQGMISQADHDKVYDLSLNDFIDPTISNVGSDYSYFHEYLVETVINDLMDQNKMTYDDAERLVYTGGLQIYSTVDSTAQKVIVSEFADDSNFPYVDPPRDADGNILNSDGEIAMYNYNNDFDENGNFRLSGEAGDVSVNSDGTVTINKGHKLHIYETEVEEGTDYSLEFKSYYLYDDDTLYSIAGGYVNIPMAYKSLDSGGNVVLSADYFSDPTYSNNVEIDGSDVVFKPGSYSLSTRSRQPQAAMTIVGVGTGEVKAMVGGRTAGGQKLLNRSLNPRQPGSSIKPLAVYGAALQKSYELNKDGKKWKLVDYGVDKQGIKGWGDYVTCHSSVEDERLRIEGRYWPNNFGNTFTGKNNFITAIQQSINTCAVKILLQVGNDYSVNQLKKFGLTTVQDDTSNPVNDVNPAALALGAMTEGVEPLEMALAYAAFPGGGKVNTPVCYYKVLDRNGDVLLESKSEQSEALNEGVAWIMTNVLQSVVSANGYMYVEGFSPGGKTGTTNDEYDIWFDGFSPTYAAALWIGTDENVSLNTASTPAARLWGKIMNQIPAAADGEYSEQPSNVIYTAGCYFTEGTETGLASWSNAEERRKAMEKAREAAYEKWLSERENHKKLIPARTEQVDDKSKPIFEEVPVYGDDKSKPIYGKKLVPNPDKPIIDKETGEIIDYEKMEVDDPDNIIDYEQTIIRYEKKIIGYKKKTVEVEKEHWEYEPGWRDGDFSFDTSDYE